MTRIGLLFFIFDGLWIKQIRPLMDGSLFWSLLIVLGMTLTNACASVSNEYAIKQNSGLDLNMQNTCLYFFRSLSALIYIMVLKPMKLSSVDSFFENFDRL